MGPEITIFRHSSRNKSRHSQSCPSAKEQQEHKNLRLDDGTVLVLGQPKLLQLAWLKISLLSHSCLQQHQT
jgi:hypothetical protein